VLPEESECLSPSPVLTGIRLELQEAGTDVPRSIAAKSKHAKLK
jgi:hypothetical protein